MQIVKCPKCDILVLPMPDGLCPSCRGYRWDDASMLLSRGQPTHDRRQLGDASPDKSMLRCPRCKARAVDQELETGICDLCNQPIEPDMANVPPSRETFTRPLSVPISPSDLPADTRTNDMSSSGSPVRSSRLSRAQLLGWSLKIVALAYFVTLFLVYVIVAELNRRTLNAIMVFLPIPGLYLLYTGYRLCQRTFTPGAHPDPRRPILFLRSFADDDRASFQPDSMLAEVHGLTRPQTSYSLLGSLNRRLLHVHPVRIVRMFLNIGIDSTEEVLALGFNCLGPLIAIGRPGEKLPEVGSDRMYVGDDEWRQVVREYLRVSRAVVLQPSKGGNILWEIDQTLENIPHTQVLLSMINFFGKPHDYEVFRAWISSRHNINLPGQVPDCDRPCFVYFDSDGTPQLQKICYRSPLLWSLTGNAIDICRTLHSFIQNLRGRPHEIPREPKRHAFHGVASLFIYPAALSGISFFICVIFFAVGVVAQSRVEQLVRDGMKSRGLMPDNLTIREQGNGKYTGTALIGGETWDVTAMIKESEVRWEAHERITTAVVERMAKEIIKQQTGQEPQSISLTEYGDGKYKGTAFLNGIAYNVTATVVGEKIQCELNPSTQQPE